MNMNALTELDLIGLLQKLDAGLTGLAERMHMSAIIFYAAAAVVALIIGIAGMHLAKILSSFTLAGIGFLGGSALFGYLKGDLALSWLAKIPDGFAYILGLIVAIVFFILGWKKCLHVIFGIFTILGYVVMNFYVPGKLLLAIGAAVLLGMIAISLVRLAFAALTSFVGGFVLISMVSAIWPAVAVFQLGSHVAAAWIAAGVSVVLFVVQMITTRRYFLED